MCPLVSNVEICALVRLYTYGNKEMTIRNWIRGKVVEKLLISAYLRSIFASRCNNFARVKLQCCNSMVKLDSFEYTTGSKIPDLYFVASAPFTAQQI